MQRYELHKSQISDDFVYWFRNGEDIFQAVFRKKSLKMSVLYKKSISCHVFVTGCFIRLSSTTSLFRHYTTTKASKHIVSESQVSDCPGPKGLGLIQKFGCFM